MTPRRIRILPDSLANQIAAGEVVERPASVVKELVENALDAAATRIDIVVRNGGKTEIRVADDGCGMDRQDAAIALDRHATSKIASERDLEAIRTLGFRGEALPSIASVSRMDLETAEPGRVGARVRVKGGRITGVEDCARQGGTTVAVRNLFFNVPARAKFLKSAAVETRAITEAVTALALANLSTAFRLESNGRTLIELAAAGDLATRVAALWGDEVATTLVPVDHRAGETSVAGLIERPDAATSGPRRTYLFLAGRPFRDRGLLYAAERGYRTTVPHGTRPSLFLYLDVAAGGADVNVHPSKAEVRFRNRSATETVIEEAVREALGTQDSAATLDTAPALPQLRRRHESDSRPADGGEPAGKGQLQFFVSVPDRPPPGDVPGTAASDRAAGEAPDGAAADRTGGGAEGRGRAHAANAEATAVAEPGRASLWQVHDTYILAETQSGLLIIDQHSAHERILFAELARAFDAGGGASQRLLFPITLRLSPSEYAVIEDLRALFERAGFEIEPFGGRTVIVHASPTPHPYFDAERCLREMIAELTEGSELTRAAKNQHERIAMTFACKAAIKAGQRLSRPEMEELFERLFATELPYHDVHGRPTIVRLSLDELQRRFGRHG